MKLDCELSEIESFKYFEPFSFFYAWENCFRFQQTPWEWKILVNNRFFHATALEGVDCFMVSYKILEDFNNFLLLDKGLGENTRVGHLKSLNAIFNKFCSCDLSNEDFRSHILEMYSKDYSDSHLINTMNAVQYFCEFRQDPLFFGKKRRRKKLIKDCLTEAEISLMINFCKDLREKAIIVLLAYSGIRNEEFCNLRVYDVDFGNKKVLVRCGKYSKDRYVNVSGVCANLLVDYVLEYGKKKDDFLFTTILKDNQLACGDLRKIVKVVARRANIGKRVYPHLFRHSLATNLLIRGASIFLIKEQLGHSCISVTADYINLLPIDVKNEYERYVPSYV